MPYNLYGLAILFLAYPSGDKEGLLLAHGDYELPSWQLEAEEEEEDITLHCTENSKQIFPEMNLRGLVPNYYIHVSESDLYMNV